MKDSRHGTSTKRRFSVHQIVIDRVEMKNGKVKYEIHGKSTKRSIPRSGHIICAEMLIEAASDLVKFIQKEDSKQQKVKSVE